MKKARRNIQIADHMLTQTYPLVKDPKLLIAVMDNLFLAMSNGMDALLFYEREQKMIAPFHNSFDAKFDIFKLKVAGKYGIELEYITLLQDVKTMVTRHKQSPIEFARKDKFIICSEEYNLTSISLEQMKGFIGKAKQFIDKINKVIDKARIADEVGERDA